MRWLLGIDLFGHCSGALQVARWLRDASAGAEVVLGVHVPDARLDVSEGSETLEQVSLAVDVAMLRRASVTPSPLQGYRIVAAPSVDSGLTSTAAELECDAILIGRAERSPERPRPPLGATAQRLLRHLPVPVMLAPAELVRIGEGPILLATDLGAASVAAGRFARKLADSLGKKLAIVSVDVTGKKLELMTEWIGIVPRRAPEDVRAWAEHHELGAADVDIRSGNLVDCTLQAARDADAPLIVCGSRCLSVADHVYTSSAAAELARSGEIPVLVAPE